MYNTAGWDDAYGCMKTDKGRKDCGFLRPASFRWISVDDCSDRFSAELFSEIKTRVGIDKIDRIDGRKTFTTIVIQLTYIGDSDESSSCIPNKAYATYESEIQICGLRIRFCTCDLSSSFKTQADSGRKGAGQQTIACKSPIVCVAGTYTVIAICAIGYF